MNTMVVQKNELITKERAAAAKRSLLTEAPLQPGQSWLWFQFSSVDAALTYLNEAPVQSAGEVAATARNDGTVGMLTIFPPTAPLQPPQQWVFQNFATVDDALNYLNLPPAQSDGEVSATLRNDGTVGAFFIEPA
jgi:hypothetical protein